MALQLARRASRSLALGLCLFLVALVGEIQAAQPNFSARIDFPSGWSGEGVAVGRGHVFYATDTTNSTIYRGDLRTGEGAILIAGDPSRRALGLFADNSDRLFVAGSRTGKAYVFDVDTGALLATYTLTPISPLISQFWGSSLTLTATSKAEMGV